MPIWELIIHKHSIIKIHLGQMQISHVTLFGNFWILDCILSKWNPVHLLLTILSCKSCKLGQVGSHSNQQNNGTSKRMSFYNIYLGKRINCYSTGVPCTSHALEYLSSFTWLHLARWSHPQYPFETRDMINYFKCNKPVRHE